MTQKEIKDKIADYKKRLDNKSIKEIPSAVRKIESEIAKYESMLEDEKESSETIKVYVKNLKDKGLVDATWFPSEKSYYVKFKDGSDGYFEKKDLILPSVLSNKKPKKDSKIKTETKIKLDKIRILWAEGNTSKYDKFPKDYNSWQSANKALIPVLIDNEKNGGGGYNKTKFLVSFKDGYEYEGRLDISKGQDDPTITDNLIGNHIYYFLSHDKSEEGKSILKKYDLEIDNKVEKKQKSESKKEPKTETKKYEYDCEELISKAKERHEKSKERAKVESKKSEVVKAKEKIDRTHEQIEHKIEKGEFTKAQIQKLIVETTELLKMLEKAISKFD